MDDKTKRFDLDKVMKNNPKVDKEVVKRGSDFDYLKTHPGQEEKQNFKISHPLGEEKLLMFNS